jgi:hypothetical protein
MSRAASHWSIQILLECSPAASVLSFKESADHVKEVGAQHFIISTDLGQTANPSPPDGLGWLIGGLMSLGITKEQIQTMGRENPGKLLMG